MTQQEQGAGSDLETQDATTAETTRNGQADFGSYQPA